MKSDGEGAAGATSGDDYFDASEFAARVGIEDHHYWPVHRCKILLAELRAVAPPPSCDTLIELGTGIGTVATYLNAAGYRVDYGDFFPSALGFARALAEQRLGERVRDRRFMSVDVTKPLDLHGYGGALLLDVIEHLPDDAATLRHVREGLGPGGLVMVTVPAFQLLWSPWDEVERHKRRYTRGGLVSLLERTGFEVVRSTYFFAPLFFAALGVKGLRLARGALFGARRATHATELTEMKSVAALNRLMLGVLSPEAAWLRHGSLPLGTSVLAIARAV